MPQTTVKLGQGHRKVIQYFSQTYTFFVPNIQGLAQTVYGFAVRSKSHCGGSGSGGRGRERGDGNEMKT